MDRRRFLVTSLAGVLAAPLAGEAQQAGKMYRIGFLSGHRSQGHEALRLLPGVLAEMGYSEGPNIAIDWRWGEGAVNRLPLLAAVLVRIPVDALIPFGNEATLAAMKATTAVPIVMVGASNPVTATAATATTSTPETSLMTPQAPGSGVMDRRHFLGSNPTGHMRGLDRRPVRPARRRKCEVARLRATRRRWHPAVRSRSVSLLTDLDAFYTDHRLCGELDAGVDWPVV